MTSEGAELSALARRIRGRVVEMAQRGKAAHVASALSCVDLLVAAHFGVMRYDPDAPRDPDRDRLILSKGHAAAALYALLAERGVLPEGLLAGYNTEGSPLAEHPPGPSVAGVEAATGSLGHGLPLGIGMALSARLQRRPYRVFAILSDGECNEGSVWEAAMFAAAQRLGNVCVMVDYNKWQATGRSNEVLALSPLRDKWAAFGWEAREMNGHDPDALAEALRDLPGDGEPPRALICHTVKGKGVSFMEDDNNWHYRVPKPEEVAQAHRELGLA